jgi:hypothetical protein
MEPFGGEIKYRQVIAKAKSYLKKKAEKKHLNAPIFCIQEKMDKK